MYITGEIGYWTKQLTNSATLQNYTEIDYAEEQYCHNHNK